jgi:hypothetical protein
MTDSEGSLSKPPLATRLPGVALAVLIGAAAYVARLVPVVRGGGLRGMNSYDGSVYYAAAAGLAHGLLPYRDFLFLHPPGIVVALVPFAALGRVIGDPSGIEVATLAWFGIGALNAVLVSTILRPLGVVAALIGGLFYAVNWDSRNDHSTLHGRPRIGRTAPLERQLRSKLPCCWADRTAGSAARRLRHGRRSEELDPNRSAGAQLPTRMHTRG